MPLSIPTRASLQQQILADIQARVPGADTTLRRSTLVIMAYVWAGSLWLAYRFIVWLSKQLFIWSCESDYLDRKVNVYGITRTAASSAAGGAIFAGTPGLVIPLGTVVQTSDASQQFITQAAGTIAVGGTVDVSVLASTPGAAGNLVAGAPLILTTAIAGVQPAAAVDGSGFSGGIDQEADAALRTRGLARIQQPPQGGAGTDFWAWARASGIPTRAWVFPLNRGPGTCDVTFTIDTRENPIPLSADLTAVLNYIEPLAPVIGDYECFAPVADTQAVTIANMTPSGSDTQALVTAALVALYASVPPGGATYGDGVTEPLTNGALFPVQTPGKLYISQIEAAIESVGTIISYDLTAPASDVTFATGHLPAAPTVTYT